MSEQAQINTENFTSAGPKSFAQQSAKEIDVWDPKNENSLFQTSTENSEKKQKLEEMAKRLDGKK